MITLEKIISREVMERVELSQNKNTDTYKEIYYEREESKSG